METKRKKVENHDWGSMADIKLKYDILYLIIVFCILQTFYLAAGISQAPSSPEDRWLCTQLNLFVHSWSPESKTIHLTASERRNFSVQNSVVFLQWNMLFYCFSGCWETITKAPVRWGNTKLLVHCHRGAISLTHLQQLWETFLRFYQTRSD